MNIKIRRTLLFVTLTLLVCASNTLVSIKPTYADVKYKGADAIPKHGGITKITVLIYGTISKADADYFKEHAAEYETNWLWVELDSLGGDVDAAMQIGRIIRKTGALTWVFEKSKCYSSCGLIYIAGIGRHNSGAIGLHRPYFATAPQARQSIERQAPLMLQQLKAYVEEMGVTDSFYQEMVNTEPSALKLYAGDAIKSIVPMHDPTQDEVEVAYDARRYGVADTAEMRRRLKNRDESCPRFDFGCYGAELWGLSKSVYALRKEQLVQCKLSDEEERALKVAKNKERLDHPLFLKRETCERKIMLGR